MQREITNSLVVTVNYVGSQSHFIAGAGGIRGLYAGQLDPKWLALGSNLSKPATAGKHRCGTGGNRSDASHSLPGIHRRCSGQLQRDDSAHVDLEAPVFGHYGYMGHQRCERQLQRLPALCQPAGFSRSDSEYQLHLFAQHRQRGYDAQWICDSGGFHMRPEQDFPKDRIDRSNSINSQPQSLSIFGVYDSPFGKGKIGGDHFVVRALLGGWQISEIFQYSSGIPLALVGTCNATQNVGQGTCMPDANPNFHGSVRQNGGWGDGRYRGYSGNEELSDWSDSKHDFRHRSRRRFPAPAPRGLTAIRRTT